MNPKHVYFLQKPKTNSQNACPRMPSPPNRGKTHGNERARPDNNHPDRHHWKQTGPTLHYPPQRYDATRKQSARQNSPDIHKGRNNPFPNLSY